jgi:hypothetical protein
MKYVIRSLRLEWIIAIQFALIILLFTLVFSLNNRIDDNAATGSTRSNTSQNNLNWRLDQLERNQGGSGVLGN